MEIGCISKKYIAQCSVRLCDGGGVSGSDPERSGSRQSADDASG